jgi:hypothetical protein
MAREHMCQWETNVCTQLCMHANGCAWGEATTRAAARDGKLEVSSDKWAPANGLPERRKTTPPPRHQPELVWYDMVWCPSYPPSVCSVTEGGGVMQRPSGQ